MTRPPMRPTHLAAVLSAALAIACAPRLAAAQSLSELYEAARAYDATYLSAKALADSAQYRVEQTESLARPSLALTANANASRNSAYGVVTVDRSTGGTPTVTTNPGDIGTAAASSRTTTSTNGTNASVNGRYPLFNRPNSATIEQARRSLISSAADLEAAEQDLIVRVAQAYFDVLAAQDTLATTRANKTAITEQLASARRNFEVGTATITDTREAQARFDLSTAQEIAADNDLRTKRLALDQLVGRQNVVPKPLAVATLPAPLPASAEDWVQSGDFQHPSVRKARVNLDVATLEVDKARAAALPTLDATASAGVARADGSFFSPQKNNNRNASVGVQLNWQLYSGGQVQNRVSETLALEERARNDLEAARRAVAQAARVAYFGVLSGLSQVRALEAAQSSNRLAVEATQLGYKVGVRVNVDVLNAQSQLFQTERDLSRARYDVVVNSLRLRQAAGQLTEADVAATNRLLVP